jgi:hypothetical protein
MVLHKLRDGAYSTPSPTEACLFVRFGCLLYRSAMYTHPVSLPSEPPPKPIPPHFQATDLLVCKRHYQLQTLLFQSFGTEGCLQLG